MREVCVEKIAMSTRVALPMFMGCCSMSELRRQLLPSPPPTQDRTARVRKNLFGPIDHDENHKFVQDELNKISQADCKRWNFDFEAEKPKEGRYNWEPVGEAVPQAYEMPQLTALTTHATTTTTTTTHTTLAAPKPVHKSVPECSSSSKSEQQPSTSSSPAAAAAAALDASTPTTTTSTSLPTAKLPNAAGSSKAKASQTIRKAVKLDRRESSRKKALETTRITRKSSQPPVTEFLKISKRKRPATTKLEEDPPPALVKRSKTTSSS